MKSVRKLAAEDESTRIEITVKITSTLMPFEKELQMEDCLSEIMGRIPHVRYFHAGLSQIKVK